MSLFTRLFKREDGQEDGQRSSADEPREPAPAAVGALQFAPANANAMAPTPIVLKPAAAGSLEPEAAPLPMQAAAAPRDAEVMSEKYPKPGDATIKMTVPTGGERPDPSGAKATQRGIPAPPAAPNRLAPPDPRAAPRGMSAGLLKAAQAAADKRAATTTKPGTELQSAKAAEVAPPANTNAAVPPPVPGAASAAQPPRPLGTTSAAGAPVVRTTHVEIPAPPARPTAPQPSPRELFDACAPQLLDDLLHLMLELHGSQAAPGHWAEGSATALRKLRSVAAKLDHAPLLSALDAILVLLERVEEQELDRIDGALRDELLRAYANLREHLPAASDPAYELARRDPLLVEQILLQVNGVQLTTLRKLHAAGWTTSDSFLSRSAEELARDTGIDAALAERIRVAFRAFRGQFATLVPAPQRSEELSRLAVLLEELRAQQARFERASARFGDEDLRERREQRTARARSVRGIYALLARLGELDRIAALERAPFQAKIAALTSFLSAANRSTTFVS